MTRLPPLFFTLSTAILAGAAANAASFRYELELRFSGDYVSELQRGDPGDVCYYIDACYPADFRLAEGYFADLTPGQSVAAFFEFYYDSTGPNGPIVTTTNAAIGSWDVTGFLSPVPLEYSGVGTGLLKSLWGYVDTTGELDLDGGFFQLTGEGPYSNYPGQCDPSAPPTLPTLPPGYCGYFGYTADFEVLSMSAYDETGAKVLPLPDIASIPTPASLPLAFAGIAALGALAYAARKSRG